ncbi:MAG TPA: hypothetical protein DEA50_09385, partial [Parvularcula sp.]|nr:hypothetical protein [Parvularcula sp.]
EQRDGAVTLFWGDKYLELEKGDTITVPKTLVRSWWSNSENGVTLFVVRGGDSPAAPIWIDDQLIEQKQNLAKMAS